MLPPMRSLLALGSSALLLLGIMFLGSLGLWIGLPLGWLWVASQVQAATGSLGAGLAVAFFGLIVSILAVLVVLARLSDAYRRRRVSRGLDDTGNLALEIVMVTSAGIALVGFGAWFFLLSGAAPFPT